MNATASAVSTLGIFEITSNTLGMSAKEIISKRRIPACVRARQVVCALADEFTNDSHGRIATVVRRDRTTVLTSIQKARQAPAESPLGKELDLCRRAVCAAIDAGRLAIVKGGAQ